MPSTHSLSHVVLQLKNHDYDTYQRQESANDWSIIQSLIRPLYIQVYDHQSLNNNVILYVPQHIPFTLRDTYTGVQQTVNNLQSSIQVRQLIMKVVRSDILVYS